MVARSIHTLYTQREFGCLILTYTRTVAIDVHTGLSRVGTSLRASPRTRFEP